MTPIQMRMARAYLELSQEQVAERTGLSPGTIKNAESGISAMNAANLFKLRGFYEASGLEFTEHNGVREVPTGLRTYRGRTEFRAFYDDLYETAKTIGGDIWIYNGVSEEVMGALGEEGVRIQRERMTKIKKNFTFRVIVKEGDNTFFGADYCEYKWVPAHHFEELTIFVFGTKVALADFRTDVSVVVIDNNAFASSFRLFLNLSWEQIARVPE